MTIEIREMKSQKAVCISHSGPYYLIGQTFERFGAWAERTGIETGMGVGFYYDDPESTAPENLRSDAGAFVADDFSTEDPAVHIVEVAAGEFMVATYSGAYDGLPAAWGEFAGSPLPEGYFYRDATPFELYVQMIGEASGVTELYMAVEKG